jgi:galactokinase
MRLELMAERTAEMFTKCFGEAPGRTVAAPGRVNLIGEHTDYNDGFVLPMAIQNYTLMAGSRTSNREVTLHSDTTGDTAEFSVRNRVKKGDPPWSNYIRGVVAGFQDRGQKIGGFSGVIDSTLPYGGGLASSAALEVAAATLIEALYDKPLDPLEKALLCQKAEHDFAGVPCGIMDQYASILAKKDHALLLDCRTRETTLVRMQDPSVTVMIVNTNVRHRLAEGEYAKRRAQCEAAAKAFESWRWSTPSERQRALLKQPIRCERIHHPIDLLLDCLCGFALRSREAGKADDHCCDRSCVSHLGETWVISDLNRLSNADAT